MFRHDTLLFRLRFFISLLLIRHFSMLRRYFAMLPAHITITPIAVMPFRRFAIDGERVTVAHAISRLIRSGSHVVTTFTADAAGLR